MHKVDITLYIICWIYSFSKHFMPPLITLLDNDAHITTKTSINFFQTFEMQLKINRKIYIHLYLYTPVLQLVSDTLVQLADAISWGAHCWQFLQEDESSSAENVPEGHFLQDILNISSLVNCFPHGGCNPNPGWHVAQGKHFTKLPLNELTTVYSSSWQILLQ